ncbi:hypothetical protein ACRRTK_005314 [Alexandromys fortis]
MQTLQDLQALGSHTTLHRKVEKSLKKSYFGFNRGFPPAHRPKEFGNGSHYSDADCIFKK